MPTRSLPACQANPTSAYAAYSSNLEQEFASKAEFQQRLAIFTSRLELMGELNAAHPDFFVSRLAPCNCGRYARTSPSRLSRRHDPPSRPCRRSLSTTWPTGPTPS
jgi:hypothetical protein